ncbi:MAG: AI-2E family transporter [Methylophilaceae bacterium]|nr:AI-2E family transporter [Methylophilaceae bacterium]
MTKHITNYRGLIFLVMSLGAIYLLAPILTPFLAAAILAYITNPIVDKLDQASIKLPYVKQYTPSRSVATILVLLLLILIVLLLVMIVVPLLQKEVVLIAQRLPSYLTNLRTKLDPWLLQNFGLKLNIDTAKIQAMLGKNWQSASNFVGQALLTLGSQGLVIVSSLINLFLVPLVLFYLMRDWHQFLAQIEQLIPRRYIKKTLEISHEIDAVLGEFLRGQLTVMLLMSAFYAIGLYFVGLDLALPIGLLAGLLGFVPYLGIGLGIILALASGFLQFTSLGQLIPIAIVFGLGQVIESMILTPNLVGDRIGLHPVAVIFALMAGGQLFGFAGILLALPVTAAIAVGLRHIRHGYLASDYYQ